MITYNGGSIDNLVLNLSFPNRTKDGIYVTDTIARAMRYANAQAGGLVSHSLEQTQAEGTVILHIDAEPRWLRRPDNHPSLDHCEAVVKEYRIIKATIRFPENQRTVFCRFVRKNREQVLAMLAERGIEVEVVI